MDRLSRGPPATPAKKGVRPDSRPPAQSPKHLPVFPPRIAGFDPAWGWRKYRTGVARLMFGNARSGLPLPRPESTLRPNAGPLADRAPAVAAPYAERTLGPLQAGSAGRTSARRSKD